MFDAIALNATTVLGAVLAVLVFGSIRFGDDVVDLVVAARGAAAEPLDEPDSPNS